MRRPLPAPPAPDHHYGPTVGGAAHHGGPIEWAVDVGHRIAAAIGIELDRHNAGTAAPEEKSRGGHD
jgi:hypothetical protein